MHDKEATRPPVVLRKVVFMKSELRAPGPPPTGKVTRSGKAAKSPLRGPQTKGIRLLDGNLSASFFKLFLDFLGLFL